MNKHKIIVAITGASGSIYAKVLLDKLMSLNNQIDDVGIVKGWIKKTWINVAASIANVIASSHSSFFDCFFFSFFDQEKKWK